MIKKYLKKYLAISIITTSIIALNPIGVSAEWKQDNLGWWYNDGGSWITGWKEIEGNWYYFNRSGYMAESKLVDNYNYFIESTGKWVDSTNEIKQYSKMIKNKKNLEQYDDIKSDFIDEDNVHLIDIDQDGIYEMIVDSGSCMGNMATTVFKYENGTIYHDTIHSGHTGYVGYDSSSKQFLTAGQQTGGTWATSYKYENHKCIEVDKMEGSLIRDTYTLNGNDISKDELESGFLNKFKASIPE